MKQLIFLYIYVINLEFVSIFVILLQAKRWKVHMINLFTFWIGCSSCRTRLYGEKSRWMWTYYINGVFSFSTLSLSWFWNVDVLISYHEYIYCLLLACKYSRCFVKVSTDCMMSFFCHIMLIFFGVSYQWKLEYCDYSFFQLLFKSLMLK